MNVQNKLTQLEKRVKNIEKRNKKVELDKAWETSYARRAAIAIVTYVIISLYFIYVGVPNPLINAVVPTAGFLLSTLSLSVLKSLWIKTKS